MQKNFSQLTQIENTHEVFSQESKPNEQSVGSAGKI